MDTELDTGQTNSVTEKEPLGIKRPVVDTSQPLYNPQSQPDPVSLVQDQSHDTDPTESRRETGHQRMTLSPLLLRSGPPDGHV